MIYVLTGNGKGKTTSAIGMAVRAAGAGKKVLFIQFLKPGDSSEIKALKSIKDVKIFSFGRPRLLATKQTLLNNPELKRQGVKALAEEDTILAKQGWQKAKEALVKNQADMLILDEVSLALYYQLLDLKEVLDFLKKYGAKKDVVLTGRYCPKEILELANLVTQMQEIKHPYQKGISQKKGIEF
jgi:cob(I)alamin adenosyltransferase